MILSDISIKRPVFASVISLLLLAFGAISYDRLTLREYPAIDQPVVSVDVRYPGAPANVVESRITQIVEERIAGVEGIDFIGSDSRDGRSLVTISFNVDRDIDAAANDVRDRIAGIADNLPEEAEPPEVEKSDSSNDVIFWQNLTSDRLTIPELTDYAERFLVDQYSTLDGVARVRVGGGLSYAMRIWLDRNELAARNLSVGDVEDALRDDNVELPAGSLESDQTLFKARVDRNFKTPQQFATLVLGEGEDGSLIRLGDVARVELGYEEDRVFMRGNEIPMVGIGIIRQSTANTLDVVNAAKELTKRLNPNLPEGMVIEESYNAAVFIEASIQEVFQTLLIAIGCVVFIIYIFLGNLRAMLIPAITVPVSLVATFIVIYAMGFTINLLTLLALVLAIGLVVDDAIVMLENIVRRMNDYCESPLVAAYRGARQVGFAVIATTLVLIAVFVPITFLDGDIGRLFTEFAITIAAAVSFSSLIALTLSPMLASQILNLKETQPNPVIRNFDTFFNKLRDLYMALLCRLIKAPIVIFSLMAMMMGGIYLLYPHIKQEFTPREDRGGFFISVRGPEGASFSYMTEYMDEIERRLMPYTETGEFRRLLIRAPGFGSIESFNSGFVIVLMDDWANRRPATEIMGEVRRKLADLPGIRAFPIMRQGLGGGRSRPVQFVIGGSNYEDLAQWRDILLEKVREDNPGFLGIDSDFKETRPQIDFVVDYERAAELGVTILEIGRTLETMMGGRNVTTYLDNGEEYDVIIEGERDDQRSFEDIQNIYVMSDRSDELIPLSNLVEIRDYGAADRLARFNRIRAITIEANLEENYTLGEALTHLENLAREHLPSEAIIDYKGQSRDFMTSGESIVFVFILGMIVVFLVLAAQFESYVHPFIIMLTVPLAVGGGLLGLYLSENSLNIYSQIGLIMLVGLSAKNGILIVEFANQLRDEGKEFSDALIEAAHTRFRPIVMTGLTTIAGAIPLIVSSGAGAETRNMIGIVVLSGVIAATIFTLFIVPLAYNVLARRTGSPQDVAKRLMKEQNQEAPQVAE